MIESTTDAPEPRPLSRDEREEMALEKFKAAHPQHAGTAIPNSKIDELYDVDHFGMGVAAFVTRREDGVKGYLYWSDEFEARIYFGFRRRE